MAVMFGDVCPGIKNRTGALIAAIAALFLDGGLIVNAILCVLFTYRESLEKVDRRSEAAKEMLLCYYGAGFAIWGVWGMLTIILIFGIVVENKRALGFWLLFTLILPLYFVGGIIFLFASRVGISGWEQAYLVVQALNLLGLVWICLAIWVYMGEIRKRDKNPELRVDEFVRRKENELMFAQPFGGVLPPTGSYNPGYGAPGTGSMSSIPRSQKSRHTYAPTETAESVRAGSTVPRQSRLDQYRAQHVEKDPIKSDRSPEREGGTTYYRYQYTTDQQKDGGDQHDHQPSLSGMNAPPPQYQPARYQRPQPNQQTQAELYGSRGSLGERQQYKPQHHASQGSMGGRQPYQPQHHASQGSIGGRQAYQPQHHASQGSMGRPAYQPRHHASQGSLGGRQPYQLQAEDTQYSKDSEV